MVLLIDAYNLLHQSDLMGRGRGPGWLHRARLRLVQKLESHLGESLAAVTCLVFDAPRKSVGDDEVIDSIIDIRYAIGHAEADDLIEHLIAKHSAPKRLSLVSSDHRLQRAAKRRGATFYDSDIWYDHLVERGPLLGISWPPQSVDLRESDDAGAVDDPMPDWENPFPEGYGEDLLDS